MFEYFLHDLLALAVGVFEGPNFSYDSSSSSFLLGTGGARLPNQHPLSVHKFVDGFLAEPGPQCLLWLTIFHRLAHVENVVHPVRCAVCSTHPMHGFRYKCQRCTNYNMCQQCFWTGATSGQHTNQHDVKEYTAWVYCLFIFNWHIFVCTSHCTHLFL